MAPATLLIYFMRQRGKPMKTPNLLNGVRFCAKKKRAMEAVSVQQVDKYTAAFTNDAQQSCINAASGCQIGMRSTAVPL